LTAIIFIFNFLFVWYNYFMKKKIAFILPLLIFVPLLAGAQFSTYTHVVGCDINTIPKFIKATLALFIRVGVPIGALFLIWAGYLYLSAQGNETKLASAKKNFVWATIGLGILFGAWLFAYAFQGVVNSFSGGVSQNPAGDPCNLNNLITNTPVASPLVMSTKSAPAPAPVVAGTVLKAPTQVLAQAVVGMPNQIMLSWMPSQSPGITGYNVYQNGNLVGTTADTSLQVAVVNSALGYAYTVVAINSAGEVSPASTPLSTSLSSLPREVALAPVVNPAVPKVTATIVSLSQINLSWTIVPNATEYIIKRDGIVIANVTGTAYSDKTVSPGAFTYTVTAIVGGASGSSSAPAYVFVSGNGISTVGDNEPPTVPTEIKAIIASSTQVNLSWKASTDNVDLFGYDVYRNGIKIGYTLGTSYIDRGTTLNTSTDKYTIDAYDASGNTSAQSAEAKPEMPPPPKVYYPPSTGGTGDTGGGGAIVPSSVTPPTLVNPVNPMNYGAKCDGVTNDTTAFQVAVNASDVLVPAGKTCVINGGVNVTTNNRHIECGANTVLKETVTGGVMFDIKEAVAGQRLTGVSIAGCYFLGTNTSPPTTDWNNPTKHWNIPVQTRDRVDNVIIIGNTFDRFYGQAMFETYGVVDGGHGDKIIYNTFKNCGYYGPVFVAHTNGYIGHNTMIDCAAGVENDNVTPPQLTGGNIIEYNTLSCIYGYGALDMNACAMLTGGASYDQDYTTNIVRNNSISGVANSSGAHPGFPSLIIIGTRWGARIHPAQYINNTCTNGCQIIP
jgi:fibronectin type 3 domain-containing protein